MPEMSLSPNFVVLSQPRSGSTLLCSALGQYSSMQVVHEVFHEKLVGALHTWRDETFLELYGKTQEAMTELDGSLLRLNTDKHDLTLFVDRVFKKWNGCKIMYHQIPFPCPLWRYIADYPNMKAIFLERDIIEAYVSLFLARRSDVWQRDFRTPDAETCEEPIRVTVNQLARYYWNICFPKRLIMRLFDQSKCMVLNYRTLVEDWDSTMENVQHFLGLEPQHLKQTVFKLTKRTTPELVSNWDELMESLPSDQSLEDFLISKWQRTI